MYDGTFKDVRQDSITTPYKKARRAKVRQKRSPLDQERQPPAPSQHSTYEISKQIRENELARRVKESRERLLEKGRRNNR